MIKWTLSSTLQTFTYKWVHGANKMSFEGAAKFLSEHAAEEMQHMRKIIHLFKWNWCIEW